MDIRNLLNNSSVKSVISDHNLPAYIDSSKFTRLDNFEYNKYNKKLIQYCTIYLDGNNNIMYRAESLYSIDASLRLHPKCSQTYSNNGTIIVTAHDQDLNCDSDFGFIVSAQLNDCKQYFKKFEIDIDIKPIWDYNQLKYLEEKQEFTLNYKLLKIK